MPGMDGFINFNGTLEGSIAGGDSGAVKDVKTNASGSYQSVVDEAGNAMINLSIYAKETDVYEDIQSLSGQLDNKQNILDYSTEEQDTGIKWIDGKPIYQRTFEKTINLTSGGRTWYTVLTSSDLRSIDADKIFIDTSGTFIEDSDGIYSINYSTIVGSVGGVICVIYDKTADEIQILIGGFTSGTMAVKLTLRYTKEV